MLRTMLSRLGGMFRARRRDQELDEEIRGHLDMLAARFVSQGMRPAEALDAAKRQFGGVTQMKEAIHERRGIPAFEDFIQDGRFALRQLRKAFGFTAVAVSVLALGVGANTAIFSVINAVLLTPLPYPEADRLVWIGETLKGNSTDQVTLTPDFLEWRDHNTAFSGIAAINLFTRTLTVVGNALQIHTAKASSTLLPVLRVQPLVGRNFSQREDQKGSDQVALISHGLWLKCFGGERGVLGRAITLDDRVYTVIGVLPPSFYFPSSVAIDVITPLGKNEQAEMKRGDGITIVHDVIARLKPNITLNQARARMETIESHIAPPSFISGLQMTVRVRSLQSQFVGSLRSSLFVLLCAVGFLLLMGCANLSNLLLSRAITRQKEIAIRSSLGASRSRLIRQMLVESMALASLGCIAGLVLAFCTRGILLRLLPQSVPGLAVLSLDWRVLSFAILSTAVCAFAFGLGPALLSSGGSIAQSLTTEGRHILGRTGRQIWLNALASTQIAIAIVLLCAGALMLRSFWNLRYRDLRFQTGQLLTAQIHLGKTRYADSSAQILFVNKLLENVGTLPGVEGVAVGDLPPGDGHATNGFAIEGRPAEPEGHKPVARSYAVNPAYFHVLRTPVLKGRGFSKNDRAGTLPVALVNETFARRNLPGQETIGKRLRLEKNSPCAVIVGIVADVRTAGLASPPESVIYLPCLQVGTMTDDVGILLRTAFNPAYIEPALRKQVAYLDSQQPVTGIQTMDQRLNESVAKPRLAAILLGCFATLGLLLATVGLYGVMSLLVRGRLHDIGIRLAIGARPHDVLRMILMQSVQIIAMGIVGGVCCALVVTRFLKSLLYNVSASDPLTISAVIGFLVLVTLAASYLPARRASQVDPVTTLRVE
jgi:putative ABC transport system permease protein